MSTTKLVAPAGTAVGTQIQTEYGNYNVASDLTVTVDSRAVDELMSVGYTVFSDDMPLGSSFTAGAHTVTADEATAGEVVIDTGLDVVTTFQVSVLRAGVNVTSDAVMTVADEELTVADGSTYDTTAADVIHWMAFGTIA